MGWWVICTVSPVESVELKVSKFCKGVWIRDPLIYRRERWDLWENGNRGTRPDGRSGRLKSRVFLEEYRGTVSGPYEVIR